MADSTQLEVWLQGFPRREVEARVRELESQLAQARNALALHDSFASSRETASQNGSSVEPPANRPAAIRRVLRDNGNQPMKSGEIMATLIDQGWLSDSDQDRKRFYSTLSKMATRGHVLRLHDRRYMLPQDAAVSEGR